MRVIDLRAALGTSIVHVMLCGTLVGVFSPIPLVYVDPDFAFLEPNIVTPPAVYSIDASLVPGVSPEIATLAIALSGCPNRARLDRFPRLLGSVRVAVPSNETACLHVAPNGRVDRVRVEGASAVERRYVERYVADFRFEPALRGGQPVGAWVTLTPRR